MKKILSFLFVLFFASQAFAPIEDPITIGGCPEWEICVIDSHMVNGTRYHCSQNTQCEDDQGNQCMCCMPEAQNDNCTSYKCECEDGYKSDHGDPCTCIPDCTGCTNCTSDTSWLSHLDYPGYEVLTTRICVCNTCSEFPTYRCAAGYFGNATGLNVGCTACPSNATCSGGANPSTFTCNSGYYNNGSNCVCNAGYYYNGSNCVSCVLATGNSNATSSSGSTSITGCYLSAGKTGSNTKGSYIIDTGTCNYAQ